MARHRALVGRAAALTCLWILLPACGNSGRGSAPIRPRPAPEGNVALSTTRGLWVRMVPDARGGAFAFWFSPEGSMTFKLIAQRLNPFGALLWNPEGVEVSPGATATAFFRTPLAAVADGTGGAIVAWADSRTDAGQASATYVQRIDASGRLLWGREGIRALSAAPDPRAFPAIEGPLLVPDGTGGVFLLAMDLKLWPSLEPASLRLQRVLSDGTPAWGPLGVVAATDLDSRLSTFRLASAEGNKATLVWDRTGISPPYLPPGVKGIFAQKVDADGNLLWGSAGVTVRSTSASQFQPDLIPLTSGLLVIWTDLRTARRIFTASSSAPREHPCGTTAAFPSYRSPASSDNRS